MTITTTEIQQIMQDFYHQNQRGPNTILLPVSGDMSLIGVTNIQPKGFTREQVERYFCVTVLYAAVTKPTAAIL